MRTVAVALSLVCATVACTAQTTNPVLTNTETYALAPTTPGIYDEFTLGCESGRVLTGSCEVSLPSVEVRISTMTSTGWYCQAYPGDVQG